MQLWGCLKKTLYVCLMSSLKKDKLEILNAHLEARLLYLYQRANNNH